MIRIICVGKLKKQYLIDLVNDYKLRISKYNDIEIIEVKDSNIKKESDEIKKYISNKDFIITLEIEGNELNSVDFSKTLDNWIVDNSKITFIIGGSNGLDDSIRNISNYKLSFSKLTYPHGLFRGLLLEQIYRSFKIKNNEEYHK